MRGRPAARLVGMVFLGLAGLGVGLSVSDIDSVAPYEEWVVLGSSLGGLAVGLLLTPYTLSPAFIWVTRRVTAVPIRTLIGGTIGLLVGLILSALFIVALSVNDLPDHWDRIAPALITITLGLLGMAVAGIRERELSHLLGLHGAGSPAAVSAPADADSKNSKGILVDTSAIIDGRIADITQTGFVDGGLYVPKFVLDEIQYIADSPDSLRRNRGRRGLDILNRLQKDRFVKLEFVDTEVPGENGVDAKLVSLAKATNYAILTTDFNLNKVAELQGIKVLNINELANSLKPNLLPNEELSIHITQEGKEEGQGVGFLDDGTMVVVEGGRQYLNSQMPVAITRVLQTSAGRIIFAHLK